MTDGTYLFLVGMGRWGWVVLTGRWGTYRGCCRIMVAVGAGRRRMKKDVLQIGFETLDVCCFSVGCHHEEH